MLGRMRRPLRGFTEIVDSCGVIVMCVCVCVCVCVHTCTWGDVVQVDKRMETLITINMSKTSCSK